MSAEQTAEDRCVACGADLRLSCEQVHPQHDCYHPDGHRRPEPTWVDVFKAARAAGWTPELWMTGQVHWGRRNQDGFIEHQHGWVKVRRPWKQPSRLVITLNGPGPDEDSATLINPTPTQVLAAARLVGLGGDSDER